MKRGLMLGWSDLAALGGRPTSYDLARLFSKIGGGSALDVINVWAAGDTTSNSSGIDYTGSSPTAGSGLIVMVAVDNNSTTDQDEGAVTLVWDSVGNQYSKVAEWTNGQGSAQAGATCAMWFCPRLTATLTGGSSHLHVEFSNNTSRDAAAIMVFEVLLGAGKCLAVEGTPGHLAGDGADPASLNVTTANIECLRVRAIAAESNSATTLTNTSSWGNSTTGVANKGTAATSMAIAAEWIRSTATSAASNPTWISVDHVSIYSAFKQVDIQTLTATKFANSNSLTNTAVVSQTGGAQTLTATKFSSLTASYGVAVVTCGAVTLTATKFQGANVLDKTAVISVGARTLTATKFSSLTASYGTAVVTTGPRTLTATAFTSLTASYGAASITRGAMTLTATKFTSLTASYGAASIATGPATLTATKFQSLTASYGAAVVTSGARTLTATKFDSATAVFGTAVVTTGPVTLTATEFDDLPDRFFSHSINQTAPDVQSIQAQVYNDPDSFGVAVIGRGAVTLSATIFSDPDLFFTHTIEAPVNFTLLPALFSDPDQFFPGASIAAGSAPLSGAGEWYPTIARRRNRRG